MAYSVVTFVICFLKNDIENKKNKKCSKLSHRLMLIFGVVLVIIYSVSACTKNELAQKPPNSAETIAINTKPELAQKPPSIAKNPTIDTELSVVGALISIPLSEISSIVNSKIPNSYSDNGHGADACGEILGKKICAGTKYSFSVVKNGNVAITSVDDKTIRTSISISFSGKGGFRGTGAELLDLDEKNFKGALILHADFTPRLTDDWCPQLDTSVSYHWTSVPRVEIVDNIWVDLQQQVETKLNEKIPELVAKTQNAIDCNKFREEVSSVYGSKSFPVSIPIMDQRKVHINIQPSDIGFSGLRFEPTLLKAAALITANIEVANTPLTPEMIPLPKLKTINVVPPKISLNIPFRLSYEALTEIISHAVVGKTFEKDTSVGRVTVKINGTEIYPSNGKLVIGIDFIANFPNSLFDTEGTVYLISTPHIENGTRIIFGENNFSQVLDNEFWSVVATIFEGPIRNTISRAATYDLTTDIAKTKKELTNKLNDSATIPGWAVTLNEIDMRLGRIAIAENELALEAIFSALTTVQLKH